MMESVKAVVEEVKCISGYPHIAQNPESSFCGGCCEGTVFTFTSAASNGRLKQRLRCRAATLKARKEEANDSVFSEMRMMAPSIETSSVDREVLSSTQDFMSTLLSGGAFRTNGEDFLFQKSRAPAQSSANQKQSQRRVGRDKSGEICCLVESEVVKDEVEGITCLGSENYNHSCRDGKSKSKRDYRTGEQIAAGFSLDQISRTRVQYTQAFVDDRKDGRNHKRYSSGEQVNTYHQRKLRCARRQEEGLFAPCIQSVSSEFGYKQGLPQTGRTELRMASFPESEGRLQIEAELRNLQARQHVTGVNWTMIGKGHPRLREEAHDVVQDSVVPRQITMDVVSAIEGHGKNLPGLAPRSTQFVSPANGPLACSFISFKGGIARRQGKTFSFGGETFTRAESSSQENKGTVTCTTTVSTKSFCYEPIGANSIEAGRTYTSRAHSGLAFGCISRFTADTGIKTTKIFEEATINGDMAAPLEIASSIPQEATWNEMLEGVVNCTDRDSVTTSNGLHILSSELTHPSPGELTGRSREPEANSSTSEDEEGSWSSVLERSGVRERFEGDHASKNERRPQKSCRRRRLVNGKLSSVSVDWYISSRNKDSNGHLYMDDEIQSCQNHGEEADFSPRSMSMSEHAHESNDGSRRISSDAVGLCLWQNNIEDEKQIPAEKCRIKLSEVSDFEVVSQEDMLGIAAHQGTPFRKIMRSVERSEIETQEEAFVRNEASHLKSYRRSQPKYHLTCSRQRKLPSRRHAWSRSFKKQKTGKRVNYLEKWLRRREKEVFVKERLSKVRATNIGSSEVEKAQHSLSFRIQAEEMLDTSGIRERHVPPLVWKNGYESASHILESSETVEGALASGINMLEVVGSSATVDSQSCENGPPSMYSEGFWVLEDVGECLSENLQRKESPDYTKSTVGCSLASNQCVSCHEEYALTIKESTEKVETAAGPTLSNINMSHGGLETKCRCQHSTYYFHDDGTALTELKYEVKMTANKEQRGTAAQEPPDRVRIHLRSPRRACGSQDALPGGSNDFQPSRCLAGLDSSGCFLEKSDNEEATKDSLTRDDLVAAEVLSASSPEKNTDLSLFIPRSPDRAAENEKAVSGTVEIDAFCGNVSQQSSAMSSLENDFTNKSANCAALAWAGTSLRRSERFSVDDVPKPMISRKQKTPIVVRVRNGLASGWLLQSFIWKKFGKQKAKVVDSQTPPSKDISQKENMEPLRTSVGLANNVVDALTVSLSSSAGAKGADSPDQSTSQEDKASRASQNATEGAATTKTPSVEDVISVRDTQTGSADSSVHEHHQDRDINRDKPYSTHIPIDSSQNSAFEYPVDSDCRGELRTTAKSESLAPFEARNSELRIPQASEEVAHPAQKQEFVCELHDALGSVREDDSFRENGFSGKSAEVIVKNPGENQFSPPVETLPFDVHENGNFSSDGSFKVLELSCPDRVTTVYSSNERLSQPCSRFGLIEHSRRSEEVSKRFPAHQDGGEPLRNSGDNSLGAHGRQKRSELSSGRGMRSPPCSETAVSADARRDDMLCPAARSPALSGDAATLSPHSESRVEDPYKHLSGLLSLTASMADVVGSTTVSLDASFGDSKYLPPVILKSENASSAYVRHSSLPTEWRDHLSLREKMNGDSTLPEQDDLTKFTARSGLAAASSQPADSEKGSCGILKIDQSTTNNTGSESRLSSLDVPSVSDVQAPSRRYDGKCQLERLEDATPLGAQSIPSSPTHDDSNNAGRSKQEASTYITGETPWIFGEQIGRSQREECADLQTDRACQPHKFDSISPAISEASKTFWSEQYDERRDSDVWADQQSCGAGPWLSQGRNSQWHGPVGEKGNAYMEGATCAAKLSSAQGFCGCHSRSLDWNATDRGDAQRTLLTLDQHDICTSRSQNQLIDPVPWIETQKSSIAPTFTTPLNRLRLDNGEVVQPRQVWNPHCHTGFQSHEHGVRTYEREHISSADGHTQDDVFLERFSSISDPQRNKTQHRRKSSVDFSALVAGGHRGPNVTAAISDSDWNGSCPSQDKEALASLTVFPLNRKVEPPVPRTLNSLFASPFMEVPPPRPNGTVHPNAPTVGSLQPQLPHGAERALTGSNMMPNNAYRPCDAGLQSDFRNSFSSTSPCSSINGYPENKPGKIPFKPKLCLHGSGGYKSGAWGHHSDEAVIYKSLAAQSCNQPVPVHSPSSIVHNTNLAPNPQTLRSSCRTAQPFYDPCNYNSCAKSTYNNHFPVCGPMLRQSQYHCGTDHTPGHHIPAYVSTGLAETTAFRDIRANVPGGYLDQNASKVGRYAPPQTISTRKSPWPASDKNIVPNTGDTGVQDRNSTRGNEQDSGLVWLTGEEMNLIRELRQSVSKDSTRSSECLADPEPSPVMSFSSTVMGVRESSFCAGGSNNSHTSSISRCSNYSACSSPRRINGGAIAHTEFTGHSLLKRWITSMQKAASIIQRAWRALLRRRTEKAPSTKALPRHIKDFYELIRTRQSSKHYHAPPFDDFVRSINYIQARTEGARVRRRLKSRRLQAIIMEIKEIRSLLSEMSEEANRDASAPYLYPQLCNQLQQKVLQFHTALTGPQMQARFLLRRGPATPLLIYPLKSPAATAIESVPTASQKVEDQQHPSLPRAFTSVPVSKTLYTQPLTPRRHTSRGKARQSAVKSQSSLTEQSESAKLLPWYFLAQRSPSKPINGRSSPTEFTSSFHELQIIRQESGETVPVTSPSEIVNDGISPYQQVQLKKETAESGASELYEEQRMSLMSRRKNLVFDEIPIGTANAAMFSVDLGSTVDLSNKPKRPFLKRKSIVMAPQKLDWSKVKPMVSSRLEPELKTKLSYCRHTKAVDRPSITSTSRRRKENYSKVKSRLFSYEANPSPSSSKGAAPRTRYDEQEDNETSPRSRGGSFFEATSESGDSARNADFRRPASPDLLRLKSQVQADTEAELAYHRVQASMMDPQREPTYTSRFDSARYLHKLENSEQAAKDSSIQGAQPRTQRIRLRLIPGSEENEPGRVLVQKIEHQEEEMPDLWHDQRVAMTRRRQSHSHRYASYRESSQADLQPLSKLDEPRKPSPPPHRRTVKSFASSKMGIASQELEEMFERVIAAKCGRKIKLSDIFEQNQVKSEIARIRLANYWNPEASISTWMLFRANVETGLLTRRAISGPRANVLSRFKPRFQNPGSFLHEQRFI